MSWTLFMLTSRLHLTELMELMALVVLTALTVLMAACMQSVSEGETLSSTWKKSFRHVNTRKAAGTDGISGQGLRACADQLAPVFTAIFNLYLAQSVIHTRFKQSIIISVSKKPQPACLSDYCPVTLTLVVLWKAGQRLNHLFITWYPRPFTIRIPSQSLKTYDAITHLRHRALSHLDTKRGHYVNAVCFNI